jgi:hypothetical protein
MQGPEAVKILDFRPRPKPRRSALALLNTTLAPFTQHGAPRIPGARQSAVDAAAGAAVGPLKGFVGAAGRRTVASGALVPVTRVALVEQPGVVPSKWQSHSQDDRSAVQVDARRHTHRDRISLRPQIRGVHQPLRTPMLGNEHRVTCKACKQSTAVSLKPFLKRG